MAEAKSYLALLPESLQNLQLTTLSSTIFVVSSAKNKSLSILGHNGRSIEVGKYFTWILDGQRCRCTDVLVECYLV